MSDRKDILISICVANYNGCDVIEHCINSLYQQTKEIAIEIIIHDDASTDNSVSIIKESFPTIKLIQSEINVGFCESNNRMAAIANGDYLLLLNNDASLASNALAVLLAFSVEHDHKGILSLPQYNHTGDELIDNGYQLDPFLNPVPIKNTNSDIAMVIGACLWIPRETWQKVNGFPNWFGSIAEDMLLCCQVRLMGFDVTVVNTSCYYHHNGNSFGGGKLISNTLSSTIKRRTFSERNKTFTMLATYPASLILILLPLHFILLFIEGVVVSVLNKNLGIFKQVYARLPYNVFLHRHNILALRKTILQSKKISYRKYFNAFSLIPWKLYLLFRYGLPKVK